MRTEKVKLDILVRNFGNVPVLIDFNYNLASKQTGVLKDYILMQRIGDYSD